MKLYNSLTKQKEEFVPIKPQEINLYVCGNTVYDYCHIGHARSMLTFDFITRYWRSRGYNVNYVRNITDIDDKIINRANENSEDYKTLAERFIIAQDEDAERLGILRPNHEPKATEHITEIITMTETLIKTGVAYKAENGDVYYRVRSFKDYGKLSHKTIEDLQVGARIEANEAKEDPLDFVLWKAAKVGEPFWDSPWGKGRPGWHIECSAMSTKAFGPTFDIHGGGLDLKFPHHENEIAQSEAATGKPFANYWMHAGLVQINDEKMSKSLGNFFTIREVLEKFSGEVIRFFMLSSHYRSPINYSEETVTAAAAALARLYNALRDVVIIPSTNCSDYENRFNQVLDDDFNTPEALGILFELAHEINRYKSDDVQKSGELAGILRKLTNVFGVLQQDPDSFLKGSISTAEVQKIEHLITQRNKARAEKNWALADEVRAKLTAMGVNLEDTAQGTVWRKV